MYDPERKHRIRASRNIPLAEIETWLDEQGTNSFWCTIDGCIRHWILGRGPCEVAIDDSVEQGMIEKFIRAHPERHFSTEKEAADFADKLIRGEN